MELRWIEGRTPEPEILEDISREVQEDLNNKIERGWEECMCCFVPSFAIAEGKDRMIHPVVWISPRGEGVYECWYAK